MEKLKLIYFMNLRASEFVWKYLDILSYSN